jgi:hypothetical protein
VLNRLSQIIIGRQHGQAIEMVVSKAFAPEPAPESPGVVAPGAEAAGMVGSPEQAPPGDGGGGNGLSDSGLMRGVAPGQAGMPAGGRPDLQMLMASLGQNGQANLTAGVSRRIPI